MSTNFPYDLDTLQNPTPTSTMSEVPHDQQHSNANDAIRALEAKVGVEWSDDSNSLDYQIRQAIDPGHWHTSFVPIDGGEVTPTFPIRSSSDALHVTVTGKGGTNKFTYLSVQQLDDGAGHPGGMLSLVSSGWGEWGFAVGDPTNANNRRFYGSGGYTTFRSYSLGLDFVDSNGISKLRVQNGGNVGVGSTAPAELLTLASAGKLGWEVSSGVVDTRLYRSAINTLKTDGDFVALGNMQTASDKAFYFGDPAIDGTWRLARNGNNLEIQRRESGSWVAKTVLTV